MLFRVFYLLGTHDSYNAKKKEKQPGGGGGMQINSKEINLLNNDSKIFKSQSVHNENCFIIPKSVTLTTKFML